MVAATTLFEILETQFFRLNMKVRDEKTRKHYRIAFRDFDRFVGRPATIGDLNDDNVAGCVLNALNRGRAPRTANDRRHRLHAFWRWCAGRGLLTTWPTTAALVEPDPEPRAWSQEQLRRLVATAAILQGRDKGIAIRDWWLGFLLVCWDSGARTGEMFAIRWEWLDFASGVMRVPAASRKGKKKAATYWLKSHTLDVLSRFRRPEGVIFPTAKTPSSFYHRWKHLLQKAGLPTGRSEGPQKMRRSYATWIEAAGGSASLALGHGSDVVTRRAYLDRSILDKPQNAVLFELRPGG